MLPIVRKTTVYVNRCLMFTKHSEFEQTAIIRYVSHDGKPFFAELTIRLMSHKRPKLLLLLLPLSSVRFKTDYSSRP